MRSTNGTSKIVEHIDAFVSGLTTFKMADMRTRGNREFFFWFFMRKRRNTNFQEYLVEEETTHTLLFRTTLRGAEC